MFRRGKGAGVNNRFKPTYEFIPDSEEPDVVMEEEMDDGECDVIHLPSSETKKRLPGIKLLEQYKKQHKKKIKKERLHKLMKNLIITEF